LIKLDIADRLSIPVTLDAARSNITPLHFSPTYRYQDYISSNSVATQSRGSGNIHLEIGSTLRTLLFSSSLLQYARGGVSPLEFADMAAGE